MKYCLTLSTASFSERGLTCPAEVNLKAGDRITLATDRRHDIVYTAAGEKLALIVSELTGGNWVNVYTHYYLPDLQIRDDDIEAIYHGEGRITKIAPAMAPASFAFDYNLNDHLGNVRVTFRTTDNTSTVNNSDITGEHHYYPFGMAQRGSWESAADETQRYRYNGKELNEDLGLYDYGARWYDPSIGRWGQVDPLAEKYFSFSPYNYAANNPILIYDADGREIFIYYQEAKRDKKGNIKYKKNGEAKTVTKSVEYIDGKTYNSKGDEVTVNNDFVTGTVESLQFIQANGDDNGTVAELQREGVEVGIKELKGIDNVGYNTDLQTIFYNNQSGLEFLTKDANGNDVNGIQSPATGLFHELIHAKRHLLDYVNYNFRDSEGRLDFGAGRAEEEIVTRIEGGFAKKKGESVRTSYSYKNSNKAVKTVGPTSTVKEY